MLLEGKTLSMHAERFEKIVCSMHDDETTVRSVLSKARQVARLGDEPSRRRGTRGRQKTMSNYDRDFERCEGSGCADEDSSMLTC